MTDKPKFVPITDSFSDNIGALLKAAWPIPEEEDGEAQAERKLARRIDVGKAVRE